MSVKEISSRIYYADAIHNSTKLSEMIQREIKKSRAAKIVQYLRSEEQRFFNSMVIAVYGDSPKWYTLGITNSRTDLDLSELPQEMNDFGLLHFTGEEKMFAVDGQHRLSGLKKLTPEDHPFRNDRVPIILVGHRESKAGRERTRRLFTTLNKTAIKVSRGEIIALDENDIAAIVVRMLVETDDRFSDPRIAFHSTNTLPKNNNRALTTIGNLYEIIKNLFGEEIQSSKFARPSDDEIREYYKSSQRFFVNLRSSFPALHEYFSSEDPSEVINRYRGDFGGNILFRPIGLKIITEVALKLLKKMTATEAWALISRIPLDLTVPPYNGVIWDPNQNKMKPTSTQQTLTRDLLLYMTDCLDRKTASNLGSRYAKSLGDNEAELPGKL